MFEHSILQKLRTRDALTDVKRGGFVVLESVDDRRAIRTQLLKGDHCFILMGTIIGSAIIMANIAAVDTSDLDIMQGPPVRVSTEVDYMVSVRKLLGTYLKKPDLFRAPVAWLFSSNPDSASYGLIQRRISKVLQHLHIELQVGREYYCCGSSHPLLALGYEYTVVAVRHQTVLPEIYVEGCLVYPKVYSGALTLVKESLGICKLDPELRGRGCGEHGECGNCDDCCYVEATNTVRLVPSVSQSSTEEA
jgi:hypothetical protein